MEGRIGTDTARTLASGYPSVVTQPDPQSLSLPVEVRFIAGDFQAFGPAETYTPESWPLKVLAAREHLAPDGVPLCPIALEAIPAGRGTREEHVVPQGLGVRWVKLPPGVVDDRVNNALSDCEADLLRRGTLGFLRPLFATGTVEREFDGGAGSTVKTAHHHERGMELHLRDGDEAIWKPPPSEGPGEFELTVNVAQPRPELSSRALCKAAYLALVVHSPALALRPEFAPLRHWLLHRREGDQRPYGELLMPGSPPGASFRYLFGVDADRDHRVTALKWAIASVRLHAVGFTVSLLGEPPEFARLLEKDPEMQRFDRPSDGRPRPMTFSFGFTDMKPFGG